MNRMHWRGADLVAAGATFATHQAALVLPRIALRGGSRKCPAVSIGPSVIPGGPYKHVPRSHHSNQFASEGGLAATKAAPVQPPERSRYLSEFIHVLPSKLIRMAFQKIIPQKSNDQRFDRGILKQTDSTAACIEPAGFRI
jgi:hypothetical protein